MGAAGTLAQPCPPFGDQAPAKSWEGPPPATAPKGIALSWTPVREPGQASASDHPSCGSQERRELAEPCQARPRPATEAQILQLAACPATQRRQESQVSLACMGPVGCVGPEVTQWRWAGPGALEARAVGTGLLSGFRGRWASVTASPEDPEPWTSRGGERLGH